ncbi:MAG: YncE family protein [Gemmatimonadaceae bacterium]|nr:YncE family protein [Gemmatimonadaceae bacterium]
MALVLAFAPLALSAQGTLVAGNKAANTATLVNLTTGKITATLKTGVGPHESAISPDGKWAVITDYGTAGSPGNSLTVIDIAKATVAKTISLGKYRQPHGIAFLPGGTTAAVTVEANQAVLLVDVAAGTVTKEIPTAQAGTHMIAVRGDGKMGYTSNIRSGTITEINFATGATRSLEVAPQAEGIAVTADGKEVWVGSNSAATISVVDVASWKVVATLDQGERPYRVELSRDGSLAVAALTQRGKIRLIETATRKEIGMLETPAGAQPVGMAFSADGKKLYVACQGSNAILEFDMASRRAARTFGTGQGPDGVAIGK